MNPMALRTGNGLKLRATRAADGSESIRPRWEPWPAARAAGLRGLDLKDPAGAWLSRGAALDAADARARLARVIIEARSSGERAVAARADLATALAAVPASQPGPPLLADLVAVARALLAAPGPAITEAAAPAPAPVSQWRGWSGRERDLPPAARTLAALLELYRLSPEGMGALRPASRQAYSGHIDRLLRLPSSGALLATLTPEQAADDVDAWQVARGPSMARMMVAVCGAAWKWGRHPRRRLVAGPCPFTSADLDRAGGRTVIWSVAQAEAAVAAFDLLGFHDVADAITLMEWTGAAPVDLCAATLDQLAGPTWSYRRSKTGKTAIPGISAPARARLDRRASYDWTSAGAAPIHRLVLAHPQTGAALSPVALRRRFNQALDQALRAARAGQLPAATAQVLETIHSQGLRLQDLRDTCITRLRGAGISAARTAQWVGHTEAGCEELWQKHYAIPLEQQTLDTLQELAAFTARIA